ncbi:MAG TPA: TMEM175 family protein [Gemmatimonadales bacterium]|jgi:uncharacterized membrane protein|nr:TMEM175 family protein [Gemmatimonadales bacterium]
MRDDRDTAHRLAAYSDAVFAVIVTVMVLELVVLATFATAVLLAIVAPRLSFGPICAAVILHLKPEVPS